MSVLILKNVPNEGPGTIEDFLVSNNKDFRIIDLSSESIRLEDDFDTLVVLGSHVTVAEASAYL